MKPPTLPKVFSRVLRNAQTLGKHPPSLKMDVKVTNTSFNLNIDDYKMMTKGVI